ncbi:hypothetical protein ISF98_05860 [Burkholderia pseudomallei]|nr:hypothetical protein [Burkholderia pseudomallei]
MARNLYEQLTPVGRESVAALLGFFTYRNCGGFELGLQEIAPLPVGFTIGDATRAYLAYMTERMTSAREQ